MANIITYKSCITSVNRSKRLFLKSDASLEFKQICQSIQPLVHFINRKGDIYAEAWCIRTTKECGTINRLKAKYIDLPTTKIGLKEYYCIISLNENMLFGISRYKLNVLIGHELAHIIQIVYNNEVKYGYSYSTGEESDHDDLWKFISRRCGGNVKSRL